MLPIHRVKKSVFNYEEIPAGYYFEAMRKGGSVQRFWHQIKFKEVAERIEDGHRVLDVGCGPGSFLWILGQEKKATQAVGVDVASRQIDFARQSIQKEFGDSRIQFQVLDQNEVKMPFPDESFDVVTCIEVVEHIHPFLAHQLVQECKRVLKPHGKIILTTPNYRSAWPMIETLLEKLSPVKYHDQHISKFTPNSFVKFIESVGFTVSSLQTIFVVAPFLSVLSRRLAMLVHAFEKKSRVRLGSILVIEAKKLTWQGNESQ